MLNIALPKGRLGDQVYELLASVGYDCKSIYDENRKLVFENPQTGVRYLLVKPSDVAIYVEHHAADVGIVGKDILMESNPDVYELLDLGLGKCRMCVAGKEDYVEDKDRPVRVATKFTNIAKEHYAKLGRDIDIIKLNGSIELAPILGLSDVSRDHLLESGFSQAAHRRLGLPHPGEYHPVGLADRLFLPGDTHPRTETLERRGHRKDIARSVIDNRYFHPFPFFFRSPLWTRGFPVLRYGLRPSSPRGQRP